MTILALSRGSHNIRFLLYLVDAPADDFLDAAVPGGRDGGAPLVLVQLLAHVLHRRVRALVVPQGE